MAGVNKAIVLGRLGADPELRNLPSGDSVVNFSLATSESYTDKSSGQKVEKTEWHRISFFGRAAEVIHEYCRKGSQIYVEGQLQTRKWQDKDGNDRYTTEIKGRDFTFVGGKNDNDGGDGGGDRGGGNARGGDYSGANDNFSDMDDVPF